MQFAESAQILNAVVRVLEGLQASLDESRRGPTAQAATTAARTAAATSSA